MNGSIDNDVAAGVEAWLRWVPKWVPAVHRGKAKICGRCTGSPIVTAAGFPRDTPHQVKHALVSRMHRLIDRAVEEFTEANLPLLKAELDGEHDWSAGGYEPLAGLDPEYDGLDPDPDPDDEAQPFLFTMLGLAEATKPDPPLPRPPLTEAEKTQLRREMSMADQHASEVGNRVCIELFAYSDLIAAAVKRFVEPQVQAVMDELSRQLESPQ